jgi:hypothetical protein
VTIYVINTIFFISSIKFYTYHSNYLIIPFFNLILFYLGVETNTVDNFSENDIWWLALKTMLKESINVTQPRWVPLSFSVLALYTRTGVDYKIVDNFVGIDSWGLTPYAMLKHSIISIRGRIPLPPLMLTLFFCTGVVFNKFFFRLNLKGKLTKQILRLVADRYLSSL